jgi:hypothetical protein
LCGDGGFTDEMEDGTVQSGKYTVTCITPTKTFGVAVASLSNADQFDSTKTFVTSLGTDSEVGCTENFRADFFAKRKGFDEIGIGTLGGTCPNSANFSNYEISCEANKAP